MKKIGEYTARGSIRSDNSSNRVILNDGRFDTGYQIVDFQIAPHDMDDTNTRLFTAKLRTDDDTSTGVNWNWDDNSEIGWAIFTYDSNSGNVPNTFKSIDPDNLVIEDLYITADDGVGNDVKLNYMIMLEKYEITDSQGALAMVRNRSQS